MDRFRNLRKRNNRFKLIAEEPDGTKKYSINLAAYIVMFDDKYEVKFLED